METSFLKTQNNNKQDVNNNTFNASARRNGFTVDDTNKVEPVKFKADLGNKQQQYINDRTGNYDFNLGTTGWWNNYDTSFPNRFNDAVNQVNAAGRKQYGNDWNNIQGAKDIGWYDGNPSNHDWYGSYAKGNTSYDNALNDYINGNRGWGNLNDTDWNTFASGMQNAYDNQLSSLNNNLMDYQDSKLDNYRVGTDYTNNLIDTRNQELYNNALSKLNRDRDRGYLSDVGYQTALDALNNQIAVNRNMLNTEAQNWYNQAYDDLGQIRTENWWNPMAGNALMNYNDLIGGTLGNNAAYGNTLSAIDDYANARLNDDYFLSSLLSDSYNPDEYSATGAEQQGLYNPDFGFTAPRRSRLRYNSIGEY